MSTEFLWNVHGYVNEYIRFADTKATIALAIAGSIASTVLAKVHDGLGGGMGAWGLLQWSAVLSMMLLGLSALTAAWVVVPTRGENQRKGFLYWVRIRKHESPESYATAAEALPDAQQSKEIAEHIYVLAGIASDKYLWLNISMWLGLPGAIIGALTLALLR